MSKTFLLQAIQFSLAVLIGTIQFSISMQLVLFNLWIGPLSGTTTLGQSGSGSHGNKGVLHTPKSYSITGTSPPDCLVSYLGHSLVGKGVHTFPKGICLKVNVIERLEFKLTYYNSTVRSFNHYTTRTPLALLGLLYKPV